MADVTVTRPRLRTSAKDLTNQTFGRLTALEPTNERAGSSILWLCQCQCGATTKAPTSLLRNGRVRHCGCIQPVQTIPKKHGGTATYGPGTPEYSVWEQMMYRCYIPESAEYHRYGGRGISVCERWKHFDSFHADMGSRPEGLSLERVDNDKGYHPENCKWATRSEQQRNREANHLLTLDGVTMCIAAWADRTGLLANTIICRLRKGWSVHKALTAPVDLAKRHRSTS